MYTSSLIHKLALSIFTITFAFTTAPFASAQVPFNKNGSVAGQGVINGTNTSTTGTGVRGIANSATGATRGLIGRNTSKTNQAIGVQGIAAYSAADAGFTYGVWGQSNSAKGRGVIGKTTKATGPGVGVWGESASANGKGVFGKNTGGGYGGYFDGKFVVKGALLILPNATSPNIIGGYFGNTVTNGAYGATISGGGASLFENKVTDNYGTVGGGRKNQAGGLNTNAFDNEYATVGGGYLNTAVGSRSTIAGGYLNYILADYATIAGGDQNIANGTRSSVGGGALNQSTGSWSTVPGGVQNVAGGHYSFAAGRRAKANHQGSFVWGDSNFADTASTTNNQVTFRASGGVRLFTNGVSSLGAQLGPGATAWSALSDRNSKEKVVTVDGRDVLDKLANMQVATWQYKGVDRPVRHMGPMAQDFYSAYGLGEDEKRLSTIDTDGVALAAIQGLYDVVKEKEAEIAELRSRLLNLESRLN